MRCLKICARCINYREVWKHNYLGSILSIFITFCHFSISNLQRIRESEVYTVVWDSRDPRQITMMCQASTTPSPPPKKNNNMSETWEDRWDSDWGHQYQPSDLDRANRADKIPDINTFNYDPGKNNIGDNPLDPLPSNNVLSVLTFPSKRK